MKKILLSFIAGLALVVCIAGAHSALAARINPYSFFEYGFSVGDANQLTTNDDGDITSSGSLQLGTSGTEHTKFISGTCNPSQVAPGSHATGTKQFYCAVPGVAAGDKVFVSLPSTAQTGATGLGFAVTSAYATGTDMFGYTMANLTGSATSSYPQATTSVQYWIVDN